MRIAFISYEYSSLASGGGIGTYVRFAAKMLSDCGHDVSVFTAGEGGQSPDEERPAVYSVRAARHEFAASVLAPFSKAHQAKPFEVIESAEFGADASKVTEAFPDLAHVVKLHTPEQLAKEIERIYIPLSARWGSKVRRSLGAVRRRCFPRAAASTSDPERSAARGADIVTAPSAAILERLQRSWKLSPSRCRHVPNVFIPSEDLLRVAQNHTRSASLISAD